MAASGIDVRSALSLVPAVPTRCDLASTARHLHRIARRVTAASRRVEVGSFEDRDAATVVRHLLPRALRCLDAGLALAEELQRSLTQQDECGRDESGVIELDALEGRSGKRSLAPVQDEAHAAAEGVCGLAFVVALELRARRDRLTTLETSGRRDAMLEAAESALRRVSRSMSALEAGLAPLSGLNAREGEEALLQRALRERRAYAELREAVAPQAAPCTDAAVRGRLRAVAQHLTGLAAQPLYQGLRVGDRQQMERLRERIEAVGTNEADVIAAHRLWGDLVGFVDLISQINRRQELLAHDAVHAADALARLNHDGAMTYWVWTRVQNLRGACSELDALIAVKSLDVRAWRSRLDALVRRGAGATFA